MPRFDRPLRLARATARVVNVLDALGTDIVLVESPMVGNFYRASSPDADPFVEEGDRVEVGQTLCILEAMKLFNEFKSDHAGTVRKVLVDDAQPVEFGQPLFELAPL